MEKQSDLKNAQVIISYSGLGSWHASNQKDMSEG